MKVIKKRYRLKAEVKEELEEMFIQLLGVVLMVLIAWAILFFGA